MQHLPTKRAFLKGQFHRNVAIRPPGAIAALEFAQRCNRCGDCLSACPQGILVDEEDGLPAVNLQAGACTFCNACAEACETGALQPADGWLWRATATTDCLSGRGITCRTCEDHCDAQAIRFRLRVGGLSEPIFDAETCTGCGACVAACPAGAIRFHQLKQPDGEMQC